MRRPRTKLSRLPKRRPRKRLGQHFLAPDWADKVIQVIAPEPGDAFLEIGPGTGALTLPLAATGAPVLAVELDKDLAGDLARRAPPNVTVLSADALNADVIPLLSGLVPQQTAFPGRAAGHEGILPGARAGVAPVATGRSVPAAWRFRVVGNLPYYITSPLLFRLTDLYRQHGFFFDATVMVQREVADRLVALPRSRDYGVLTILLSVHARMTRLLDLPRAHLFRARRCGRASCVCRSAHRPSACPTSAVSSGW